MRRTCQSDMQMRETWYGYRCASVDNYLRGRRCVRSMCSTPSSSSVTTK
jgi:hypothetical protein